jgi:hypothetical protein
MCVYNYVAACAAVNHGVLWEKAAAFETSTTAPVTEITATRSALAVAALFVTASHAWRCANCPSCTRPP